MPLKVLLLSLLLLSNFSALAQLPLPPDEQKVEVTQHSVYYIDESTELTREQIAALPDSAFIAIDQLSINVGYSKGTVWVKTLLHNPSAEEQEWVLQNNFPYMDVVEFHYPEQGQWKVLKMGLEQPDNPLQHNYPAALLNFAPGEEKPFFMRIRSPRGITFTLEAFSQQQFGIERTNITILYGIYFGLLVVMMLYNLFLYIALKDLSFLLYVLTLVCTFLTFGLVSGYLRLYLFPNGYGSHVLLFAMAGIVVSMALFAMRFLNTRKYAPLAHKLFYITIALAPVGVAIFYFNYSSTFTNLLISVNALLLLVAGIISWRNGNKAARFFVAAWFMYIVLGVLITLRNLGLVDPSPFVNHGAELGSALEVIILAIALSDRYRLYKRQQEEAQKSLIELQQTTNEQLEVQVQERTAKLLETNEELQQVNEELTSTIDVVNQQKQVIEDKNSSIVSSINYAKRIQQAILPHTRLLHQLFPNSFVYFKPLDVVSGDFYFLAEKAGWRIVGAIDCTGHGVPGAFMSLIGYNLLNRIIYEKNIVDPSRILTELDRLLRKTLQQENSNTNDGMDAALCAINRNGEQVLFAGAMNSLYVVQPGQALERVQGTRRPIGGHEMYKGAHAFTTTALELPKETMLYLCSDGYQDQFGGPNGQKFMAKRFRQQLQGLAVLEPESQRQRLTERFDAWKGKQKQTDDVLVLGLRL